MFEPKVIFTYSRKQAIDDGQQVCISDVYPTDCRLYKYPVYFTSSVMALVESNPKDPGAIVWDIIYMSVKSPSRVELNPSTVEFGVIVENATLAPDFQEERLNGYKLIAQVGAKDFDDPTPVVTIMFPSEI